MNRATKFVSRITVALVAVLLSTACDAEQAKQGHTTQAIIECNGGTIGLACDSDDDPCTQEVCQQQGASVQCTLAQLAPDGTPCLSDGMVCTADSCQAGTCQHVALAAGTLCDDGLFCTAGETCDATGVCGNGGDPCEDGNDCTVNSCDEVADACNSLILVGVSCDDGDACTENTSCDAVAACTAGNAISCDDGNECTDTACDPATGCTFAPLVDSPCSDSFFCTIAEACTIDGVCEGTANCNDGNACTADSCDEPGASCSNVVTPGAVCNDGNECTTSDACSASGLCTGSPVTNGTPCGSAGGCVSGGSCMDGTCVGGAPLPDNTVCDDNNVCTSTDVCLLGACSGYPINCYDGDPCTADGCDQASGCYHLIIEDCGSPPDAGPPDAGIATDANVDPVDASSPGQDAGPEAVLGGGGCQSVASTGSLWAGLLVLLLLLSLRRRSPGWALLAISLFAARSAHADGFDSELFEPATSSTAFLSQSDAEVLATWRLNLGVSLSSASDPLVLRDAESGAPLMDGVVVSRRSGAYLSAGIGLPSSLELGLVLPVVISQNGNNALLPGDIDTTSVGDPRTELKARLWRHSMWRLAAALSVTFPVGDDKALFAEPSMTFHPRLLLAFHRGPLRVGADLGLRTRKKNEVAGLVVDDEVSAGMAASMALVPKTLWGVTEIYARRALRSGSAESSPAEALLGARYRVWGPYQILLAGGAGMGRGYGTPAFRALLGLSYVPSNTPVHLEAPEPVVVEKEPSPPPPPPRAPIDSDGDGLFDPQDQCPQEAEDKDEFEDEDGCPDLDNDGDTIVDLDDACPLEAEVVNGINDTDGCPDEGIIVMIKDRVVLEETVLFDVNRARVKHEGRKALQAIITLFKQHPEWIEMRVEGHADSRGPADFNMELSQRRAQRVQETMIKLGMDPARISHQGFGETRPLVQADSDEAMQKNRRVEFVVVKARQEVQEHILAPPEQSGDSTAPAAPEAAPQAK